MKTRKRKNAIGSVLANLAGKSLLAAAAFALVAGTPQAEGVVTARDWINIGNAENVADGTGYGAVGYEYRMSSIQTTVEDWDAFYNDNTSGAVGTFNASYGTWTDGSNDGVDLGRNSPVVNVSVHHAAQYANWLTTGDATSGAYQIDASSGNVTGTTDHDPYWSAAMESLIDSYGIVYVIPTENEWYKAAYYDSDKEGGAGYWDYADGTDTAPTQATASTVVQYNNLDESSGWNYSNGITALSDGTTSHPWEVATGTPEQNATYDMMGNVWEWQEDLGGVIRGGAHHGSAGNFVSTWRNTGAAATAENFRIGFRVVAIPEPASEVLLVLAGGMVWFLRRRLMLG